MATESDELAAMYGFFRLQVVRTLRLGPTMVRITFGGEELKGFASGGRDQSFSLFLPHPGQRAPVLPIEAGVDWFQQWRALDLQVAAVMRSYTIRAQRRDPDEVDVDFALHGTDPSAPGAAGPAARWAERAAPGDRVILLGPSVEDNRSVGFRPPPGTDWVLIAGDETALPAIGGILDWLPAGLPAKVWIEVPHAQDTQDLAGAPDLDVTWLVRDGSARSGAGLLVEAVRAARLPAGTPYAWLAGESGAVRALRRLLVGERGFERKSVNFSGYWRKGASEEELRAEALSTIDPDGS